MNNDLLDCLKPLKGFPQRAQSSNKSISNSKKSHNALIKQNQILYYQLAVYLRIFQSLQLMLPVIPTEKGNQSLLLLLKKQSQTQIELSNAYQSNSKLEEQLQLANTNFASLSEKHLTLLKKQQNLDRAVMIYKKKCEEYDKIGGKSQFENLNHLVHQHSKQMAAKTKESQLKSAEIQSLKGKVKILQNLNKETEEELASLLVTKKNVFIESNKENISSIRNEEEEQKDRNRNSRGNSEKVEMYAAKQEIKELKRKVVLLEEGKSLLKQKMLEREAFYCKMIHTYNQ